MSKTAAKSSKKTATQKPVAKKVPAKKAAIKKVTAKAAPVKKAVAKKVAVRVALKKAASKPVKKALALKPAVKKPVAKKAAPNKTAIKKTVPQAIKPTIQAKPSTHPSKKPTPSKLLKPEAAKVVSSISPQPSVKVAPAAPSKVTAVKTPQVPSKPAEAKAPSAPPVKTKITMLETLPTPAKVDPKLANAWKKKTGRELTEDELLAMPDSTYMNEHQQDFFRAKLEELKNDLLSNAGETTEHLREDTSIVPDPADRATIEEEHALELRTRDRERKLLKKISQALTRIDAGDYGYCDETGEPIGLRRLLARPTATLSLEAQQRRELKQRMFGD